MSILNASVNWDIPENTQLCVTQFMKVPQIINLVQIEPLKFMALLCAHTTLNNAP